MRIREERTIDETVAMAMNDQERQLMAEAAVAAANALDRQQGVFGFGTIRPDRFPSSSYQNWRDWRKHFAWIADANRWDDEQARMVLPTCLTGWALDEFTSMPAHFREEVEGFDEPTLGRMLAELDQRMMPFQTRSTARAEFKSLIQGEREDLREFSRRVRSVGEVANANMPVQIRDDMNREQFIDGTFDADLQELLLREDFDSFGQAVARAQALEMASRTARLRNRRRPNAVREMHDSPEIESGVIGGEVQADGAQHLRTDFTRWQKSTDQRLDQLTQQMQMQGARQNQLAKHVETQNSRHDELLTQMHSQNSQIQNMTTQMQSMTSMMSKLVTSFSPAPQYEGLPRDEAAPKSRQSFETGGNSQNSAENGAGRYGLRTPWTQGACFNCGQVGHIAKGCPQRSANHLNYQGPGQ